VRWLNSKLLPTFTSGDIVIVQNCYPTSSTNQLMRFVQIYITLHLVAAS